jgi:hypothetical protein
MSKLRIFRVETRSTTIARIDGQNLVPLKIKYSRNAACYAMPENLIFEVNDRNSIPHLKKYIVAKNCRFSVYMLKFLETVIVTEVQAREANWSLDLTKAKWKNKII